MIVRSLDEIVGTERDVQAETWSSRRFVLAKEGVGFSLHDTVLYAGTETRMWYANHVEAVYCIEGQGELINEETGEKHRVEPGVMYLLDGHEHRDRPGADYASVDVGDRAQLFQAQGMVMVQMGVSIGEALVRMRAYAYAEDRPLEDVARDVVERRLRFDDET